MGEFPLLYGIVDTGYVAEVDLERVTAALIKGGIGILQFRAKGVDPSRVRDLAGAIHGVTKTAGVPLILNDYPAIAAEIGVEGVHVGQDDDSVEAARSLVGDAAIVGKSTHSLAQARAASAERVDYLGFGPLFATPTKPGRPAIGTEEIHAVHEELSLPIYCIGGIKLSNLPAVRAAGAQRVVIVSGLLQAPDIAAAVREARRLLT
jgi:thiamine-phosphate pyrophosphorylase